MPRTTEQNNQLAGLAAQNSTDEIPTRALLTEHIGATASSFTINQNALTSIKPLSPSRERSKSVLPALKSMPKQHVVAPMLSLFFTALLCATGNYFFFRWLNGTPTQYRKIHQGYVTVISLLFTTVFNGCMTGCVGFAFAQLLWLNLRRKAFTIARLEQLYTFRNTFYQLFKLRAAFEAPLLFSMGIYVWLVQFAVTYPPSALTVSSQLYPTNLSLGVPVVYPPIGNFDRSLYPVGQIGSNSYLFQASVEGDNGIFNYLYRYSNESLTALTESVLISGTVPDFPSPGHDNSSYSLVFRGPQLKCDQSISNFTGLRDFQSSGTDQFAFSTIEWNRNTGENKSAEFNVLAMLNVQRYFDPGYSHAEKDGWTYEGNASVLTCSPTSIEYNLNVSFNKGARQMTYSKQNSYPFQPNLMFRTSQPQRRMTIVERAMPNDSSLVNPQTPPTINDVNQQFIAWNEFAFLDAALQSLVITCEQNNNTERPQNGTFTTVNGTTVSGESLTLGHCFDAQTNAGVATLLGRSIFNTQRYNSTLRSMQDLSGFHTQNWRFDLTALNLTEDSLNDYITNITLSALSANIAKNETQVTVTEYRTIYDFSAQTRLIAPYSVCLGVGLVFVVVGLWSLALNGVEARDGGFLQIMMATVGRTQMEDLGILLQEDPQNRKRKKELLNMKIRYGELLDSEGAGTGIAGLGTIDETSVLRRGWRSVDAS